MKEIRKKPDEVNSYEYLSEHLWQWAHKGGFAEGFEAVKVVLPYLKRFTKLSDLLNQIENGNQRLRNRLGKDLVRLYQSRHEMSGCQTTMELLLLILWPDLTALYEQLPKEGSYRKSFASIYWELLKIIDECKKSKRHSVTDLMNQLRSNLL